jgi:hypothetical protein
MFIVNIQLTKAGYIKANGCYITQKDLLDLKQIGNISCLTKYFCVISLPSHAEHFLNSSVQKSIGLTNDDNIDCHRQPTKQEIKFGYGATHYCRVSVKDFKRRDGTLKKRIKLDGLWYSR